MSQYCYKWNNIIVCPHNIISSYNGLIYIGKYGTSTFLLYHLAMGVSEPTWPTGIFDGMLQVHSKTST